MTVPGCSPTVVGTFLTERLEPDLSLGWTLTGRGRTERLQQSIERSCPVWSYKLQGLERGRRTGEDLVVLVVGSLFDQGYLERRKGLRKAAGDDGPSRAA